MEFLIGLSWAALQDKQAGQFFNQILMISATSWNSVGALPAELIDDVQQTNLLLVVQAVLHKIIAPNMVLVLRQQPDTTAVIQPKPSELWLFLW